MVIELKQKAKIEVKYNDGYLNIKLSDTAIKILKKFSVLNEDTTESYFLNSYHHRYLIKNGLRSVLNDYGLLFFNYDVLNNTFNFSHSIGSIHQFEPIKKNLELQFKLILNYYLNYDFERGVYNGV